MEWTCLCIGPPDVSIYLKDDKISFFLVFTSLDYLCYEGHQVHCLGCFFNTCQQFLSCADIPFAHGQTFLSWAETYAHTHAHTQTFLQMHKYIYTHTQYRHSKQSGSSTVKYWLAPRWQRLPAGWSVRVLEQKFGCQLTNMLPGLLHMSHLRGAGTDGKTQHKVARQLTRHQVYPPGTVDVLQQSFVLFIWSLLKEGHTCMIVTLGDLGYW